TLILEEESQSKMLDKQNDPISLNHKINISPIDYSKINKIKEDFSKRFVTHKEVSAEQDFWLKHSKNYPDTFVKSHTPVRIEAPNEIPKTTTSDAITKVGFNSLVHSLRALSALRRSGLRTASTAVKPCQEIYVIKVYLVEHMESRGGGLNLNNAMDEEEVEDEESTSFNTSTSTEGSFNLNNLMYKEEDATEEKEAEEEMQVAQPTGIDNVRIVLKCAKITKKPNNIYTRLEATKKSQIKKQVFSK
nr:hypothetical protein [Tanacetum cinerariifolium]